jgi:hypothetical protein
MKVMNTASSSSPSPSPITIASYQWAIRGRSIAAARITRAE